MRVKRIIVFVADIILIVVLFFNLFLYRKVKKLTKIARSVDTTDTLADTPCENLPFLDPFDQSVETFFDAFPKVKKCSWKPPLTEVLYNERNETHVLQLIRSNIYLYTYNMNFKCCVQVLDNKLRFDQSLPCTFFYNEWIVGDSDEFLKVICYKSASKIFYVNAHVVVSKKKTPPEYPSSQPSRDINVLVIGIDSMSRMNLYRTMPQTVSWLHEMDWVEMRGYNKIADNTFPNVMALLTGLPPSRFPDPSEQYLDSYPFIWKYVSDKGYVTATAEDSYWMETFYCHIPGFMFDPTDNNLRDFFLRSEDNVYAKDCIGEKTTTEHVLDYMLDFVRVYKYTPFFGLFWINGFSHSDPNGAAPMDLNFLRVLKKMASLGTLETTMVVFLSDHGTRTGQIRETKQGWYEDRLPFLFISLPQWFHTQYPTEYQSLLSNRGRLTTPFDVHLTMHHVLRGHASSQLQSAISLLTPVSPDRTCTQAGISIHWCTCHDSLDLPVSPLVTFLGNTLVEAINSRLNWACAKLTLQSVSYVRQSLDPGKTTFMVAVVTIPGGAILEGTVVQLKDRYVVDGSFSRLNDYGQQSSCVNNPKLKILCYCVYKDSEI